MISYARATQKLIFIKKIVMTNRTFFFFLLSDSFSQSLSVDTSAFVLLKFLRFYFSIRFGKTYGDAMGKI